jgi:uncharacterized membrane protein YgcG
MGRHRLLSHHSHQQGLLRQQLSMIIIWLFWLRLRLIASTLTFYAIIIRIKLPADLMAVPKSFQEHHRHRSLGVVVEEVVV